MRMWICNGSGLEIGVGRETNGLTNGEHRGQNVIPHRCTAQATHS
jgi:hypothetical protein